MPLKGKGSRKRSKRRRSSLRRRSSSPKESVLKALNKQAPRGMGVTTESKILTLFDRYIPLSRWEHYISGESPFSPSVWKPELFKKHPGTSSQMYYDPILDPLFRKTQDIVKETAFEVLPSNQKGGYYNFPSLPMGGLPIPIDLSRTYKTPQERQQEWLDKNAYQMNIDGKSMEEKRKLLNQKYYVAQDNWGIDKNLMTISGSRPPRQQPSFSLF